MLLGKKRMLIELCNSGLPQTSNVWKMQYLQMRYVCVINSEHFSPQICFCRDQVQGFARPIEHCFCPWSLWSLFHEVDRIVLLHFESAQALLAQNPPVTFHHICVLCVTSLQLCPTLWDTMNCSPPVSSVHVILWARILEWVPIQESNLYPLCLLNRQKTSLPLSPPSLKYPLQQFGPALPLWFLLLPLSCAFPFPCIVHKPSHFSPNAPRLILPQYLSIWCCGYPEHSFLQVFHDMLSSLYFSLYF